MRLHAHRFEKSKNGNVSRRIQLKRRTQDTFHGVTLRSTNLGKAEHGEEGAWFWGLPILQSALGEGHCLSPQAVGYKQGGLGSQALGVHSSPGEFGAMHLGTAASPGLQPELRHPCLVLFSDSQRCTKKWEFLRK